MIEKHRLNGDSIDYYGARKLIVRMLDFLGTAEENHMVEMIPGLGKIPFWGDFSKFDRWSFYVDYYNMIDRYVLQTCDLISDLNAKQKYIGERMEY